MNDKKRLTPMLQRFFGYTKNNDESIDKMMSSLTQLSVEIYELNPQAKPTDIHMAVVIMNACQGEEYAMTKHTLNQAEALTSAIAAEQLRTVKHDIRKDSFNLAKGDRGDKQGQRDRSTGFNKSNIKCYGCERIRHYKFEYPYEDKNKDDKNDKNEKNKETRPKTGRKTSNKTPNPPKRKDKINHIAKIKKSEYETELSTKKRVWMSIHKQHAKRAKE